MNTGITGPASYNIVVPLFLNHWLTCNNALPPATPLLVQLPKKKTTVNRAYLQGLFTSLVNRQNDVQGALTERDIARGVILLRKKALLARLNQFNGILDADFTETEFYAARPYAPSLSDGQEAFSRAIREVWKLWEKINAAPPPPGVTLPLVLPETEELAGAMTVGEFASLLSSLQFDYTNELDKNQNVTIELARRNKIQERCHLVMRWYRETVPTKLGMFPELIETMPRLSPAPGHTPQAVNASAIFVAPDGSKTVYSESTDPMLAHYQLRGHVGDEWDDDLAVVVATNEPGAPREFVNTFGLNQPGVRVVFKVYVILSTGNEAGSAPMLVQRPFSAVA